VSELEDLRMRVIQLEAWAARRGYQIPPDAAVSIVCPQCGFRSYNPHDIEHRYCGQCHQFHDQLPKRGDAPSERGGA
jgi:hypothetical protein